MAVRQLATRLVTAAVVACCLGPGCTKPGGGGGGAAGAAAGKSAAARSDCYDATASKACPPDRKDPSGAMLPASGGLCSLPPCKPCGSASAPAFRDDKGTPTPGFCLCVPRSDDSGIGTFSCFSTAAWTARKP
jgi:hypothetical protein